MKRLLLAVSLIVFANASTQAQAQQGGPPPAVGGFRGEYFGPSQSGLSGTVTNYFWVQTIFQGNRSAWAGPVVMANQPAGYTTSQFVLLTWMPVQGATYDIITNQTGTFPAPSSTCTCGIDVNESSSGFTYNGTAGVFSYVIKGTVGVQIFSATPVFDASTTNYFEETLTGNVTSSTLVNTSAGQHLVFHLCQDATGSRTVSYPTNLLGATTVGSTASKCTTQEFVVNSANTNAYAIAAGTTNQ